MSVKESVRQVLGYSQGRSNADQDRSERYGIIILGNSGVGKSFIANLCLQNESFEHKCKPTAVTKETEYKELQVNGITYVIFNIPGLVEAKQEQIDINKKEIDKAFQICSNSIIIYVFGVQQGRIRNEDIIAFNALNNAYPFHSKSLVIVINGISPKRDQNYEGETTVLLREMLTMKNACKTMCFLDQVDNEKPEELMKLTDKLFHAILNSFPKIHHKEHSIELDLDKIKGLQNEISQIQDRFEQQRQQLLEEFHQEQMKYEDDMKKQHEQYEKLFTEHTEVTDHLKQQMTSIEQRNDQLEERLKQDQEAREQTNNDTLYSNPFTGMINGFARGLTNMINPSS